MALIFHNKIMKKNKNNNIKQLLKDSSNTFVDKLASLKYVTKKDTSLISSVISDALKKKKLFLYYKKTISLMPVAILTHHESVRAILGCSNLKF